jgi:hypothetical protein
MLPNVYKDSSEIVTTVDTGLRWLVAPEQVLIEICGCGDFSVHSTDGNWLLLGCPMELFQVSNNPCV